MFQSIAHNIFDDIKVEPLNYYVNNGREQYHANTSSAYRRNHSQNVTMDYDRGPAVMKGESYLPIQGENMQEAGEEKESLKLNIVDIEKKPKRQTCKICNKTLASPSSYYVHLKQHSDSKPFSCPRCVAAFCRKPYLEVHMRVHTGERPYECDVCKKRFTQKSSLNTHKRSHLGLRPYACQVCMKTFTVKSYLTAHRWAHVSDSGVSCNECDLIFTNKHLYSQHMQIHNKKDFECGECSKTFSKESYLIRHTNRFHDKFNSA
ncbi:zinc finger protein OZF-like [Euwallacea fornicatus]|uniref:zinc finger protein OZF-like n=1 Tax=Euwallacea fornicatus TaxID=995702 RepID=UPI00338E4830